MSENHMVSSSQMIDDDDQILQFTQGKRQEIVSKLTAKGIPTDDSKQMQALLATLDGMDRVALGKKRIKADEGLAGANQAMAAGVIATLLQRAGSAGVRPFEVLDAPPRTPPVLGSEIPDPVLVKGETDTVTQQMSYEAFQAANQLPDQI